ncbi:hypothetical protein B0T20DRAFT_113896 [Sordaria brevicollis]|uniref:Secreted protein n=1 Tax=Sordaria brevicollis TaxID=83679 RepID=A0AAE0PJZ0_SORBR|nr:hypothetical protein B0T20DRAFT_113896 [Sordaria brevicollis]
MSCAGLLSLALFVLFRRVFCSYHVSRLSCGGRVVACWIAIYECFLHSKVLVQLCSCFCSLRPLLQFDAATQAILSSHGNTEPLKLRMICFCKSRLPPHLLSRYITKSSLFTS